MNSFLSVFQTVAGKSSEVQIQIQIHTSHQIQIQIQIHPFKMAQIQIQGICKFSNPNPEVQIQIHKSGFEICMKKTFLKLDFLPFNLIFLHLLLVRICGFDIFKSKSTNFQIQIQIQRFLKLQIQIQIHSKKKAKCKSKYKSNVFAFFAKSGFKSKSGFGFARHWFQREKMSPPQISVHFRPKMMVHSN